MVSTVSTLSNQEILLTSNIITIAGLSTVLYCVSESQAGRFRGSGLRALCSVWEARAQPPPWVRIGPRRQSWTHQCAPPKMSFSCSFKNKSSKSKCSRPPAQVALLVKQLQGTCPSSQSSCEPIAIGFRSGAWRRKRKLSIS